MLLLITRNGKELTEFLLQTLGRKTLFFAPQNERENIKTEVGSNGRAKAKDVHLGRLEKSSLVAWKFVR